MWCGMVWCVLVYNNKKSDVDAYCLYFRLENHSINNSETIQF